MFKRYLFLSAMFFIYSFFGVFANAAGESVNNNTYISEEDLTIYFRFDKDSIDGSYLSNTKTLKKLDDILSDESKAGKIDSIRIFSTASPEGDFQYNQRLAKRRGIALSNYITENFKQINPDLISSSSQTESWEKVAYLISQDPNVKNKDSILYVLNENIPAREKERKLQSLDGGKSWQYVGRNYLRYLRTGTVCMIYYKDESPQTTEIVEVVDTTPEEEVVMIEEIIENEELQPEEVIVVIEDPEKYYRPIAFKTNLLFDALTALNVELEVPVSKRVSITGEYTFPWWLMKSKQNCLEVIYGNVEARYWIKPNYDKQKTSMGEHNPLTGWFAGVYGGVGYYDLEWHKKGYQGEVYLSTGVSAGYVKALTNSLSLEFSLGVGYLQTDYKRYEAKKDVYDDWTLVHEYNGRYKWFGPTKAKISFIWYPYFKKSSKKGGANE